jgi:hypothetical protein
MVNPVALNWLDEVHTFRRPSGIGGDEPLSAIVRGYPHDPVLSPVGGHPYADVGYIGLTSALLQLAMPPADKTEAAYRLLNPPAEDELATALESLRSGLFVCGGDAPMFQVKPARDWEPDPLPIERLLPDTPTDNAILRGGAFFAKEGAVRGIHASLVAPILYAGNVLFSQGGGGYLQTPHPPQSAKFYIRGRTFWETVYANVLPLDHPRLARVADRSPLDAFPWLRPDIRTLILKKESKGDAEASEKDEAFEAERDEANGHDPYVEPWTKSRVELSLPSLHPLHCLFAMPRRTLLGTPEKGACSISGLSGPVFRTFERWVHGYKYGSAGWWHPMVAQRDFITYDGGEEVKRETGYFQVGGILRMDDWLGLAVGVPHKRPDPPKKGKAIQIHDPEILKSFRAVGLAIADEKWTVAGPEEDTASGEGFQVSVIAQCPYSNVLGVMVEKSLPVYDIGVDKEESDRVSAYVEKALLEVNEVARILKKHAVVAARCGRETKKEDGKAKALPAIAATLGDVLVSEMEMPVIDTLRRVVEAIRTNAEVAESVLVACSREVAGKARSRAVALFDDAFPLIGVTQVFVKIVETRVRLKKDLYPMQQKKAGASSGNKDPKAPKVEKRLEETGTEVVQ